MSTTTSPKTPMTVPQFLAWAEAQPRGRYELVDGEVVAMAPERVRHNLVKAAVYRALDDAVKAANLPCTVFADGVTVVINDYTAREPDASVQCGVEADLDSMVIEAPLIVVEVSSPSSERKESRVRFIDYFSVASIHHYLIVFPERGVVVHHQRNQGGEIAARITRDGEIALNPPGMTVSVAALLGPASAGMAASGQGSGSH
jgi:Uma2 family endonuclease